jgi:hypothetical protein
MGYGLLQVTLRARRISSVVSVPSSGLSPFSLSSNTSVQHDLTKDTLTQGSVDQVIIALEFGTGEGEGGPFALFMTLFPKPEYDGRSLTTYSTIDSRTDEKRLGKLARFRWPLMVWAIFGTALTLADGVLTYVTFISRRGVTDYGLMLIPWPDRQSR